MAPKPTRGTGFASAEYAATSPASPLPLSPSPPPVSRGRSRRSAAQSPSGREHCGFGSSPVTSPGPASRSGGRAGGTGAHVPAASPAASPPPASTRAAGVGGGGFVLGGSPATNAAAAPAAAPAPAPTVQPAPAPAVQPAPVVAPAFAAQPLPAVVKAAHGGLTGAGLLPALLVPVFWRSFTCWRRTAPRPPSPPPVRRVGLDVPHARL